MNPTRNHEVVYLIPGLAQWVKDLALLCLWHRPAAVAPIRALAWETPYAMGVALNGQKTKKKKKKRQIIKTCSNNPGQDKEGEMKEPK